MTDRIYYENQADWAPSDYYALWCCFDRLAEYLGPTPARLQQSEHRPVLVQAKKTGVRDEELAAIDVAQMPSESRRLLRAVLVSQQRFDLASMADIVASWHFDDARPDAEGMSIIRGYADGKLSPDEALAAVGRRIERFREREDE